MTLQNAYEDHEFPVRPRWRWRRVVGLARRQRNSLADKATIVAQTFLAAAIMLAALWVMSAITGVTIDNFMQRGTAMGRFLILFSVFLVTAALISGLRTIGDRGLPRREQQKYLRLTQAVPLTEQQGQILALDAVSDFSAGWWNRSLEFAPVWIDMPASMHAKHQRTGTFQPFLSFQLVDTEWLRNDVDRALAIASTSDVERHFGRALSEDSLSLSFVDLLSNPEEGDAVRRLASLTGTTEAALRKLGVAPAGSPAHLLWGYDVMFGVAMTRNFYAVGYIDAERAWQHLELLAQVAFATFTSSEEYWENVRLGFAFKTDNREALRAWEADYQRLKSSDWPAAKEKFPHVRGSHVPDVVRNLRANPPGDTADIQA